MDKGIIVLTIALITIVNVALMAQNTSTISLKNKKMALQEILEKSVDNTKVFGTSFCIKYKDEVWCGSAGNMDNDQQFYIASTTKLFVTAIILRLVSQSKLSLDDKINKYLDASIMDQLHIFNGFDYSNEITIRNLLAHTSGLPDYFSDKDSSEKSLEQEIFSGNDQFWTFEHAIARTKNIKPSFPPDTKNKAHYSDANYQLLGKIIENITSKSFSENCQNLICEPLNLSKTYVYEDTMDTRPKTMHYKRNILPIPKAMTSFGADGGIVSTSFELATFIEAFFNGKLFPKRYIEELKVWNTIFSPIKSGVGIHQFKLPSFLGMPELIGHSGLSGALAYYDPKDDVFVAGTVNQIAHPSTSFAVATKLIQTLLSNQMNKTVSGIGIGTTYSSITNNDGNSKFGLSLDLYKEYKLSKTISFTTEILYTQKGERSSVKKTDIRLHYVELPLMLKLNLIKDKLGFSSGFSTNILLSSNKEKNTFKRLEYSIPFAMYYSLNDFLQVSLRYNKSVSSIDKMGYIGEGLKNNWWGISLILVKP